MQEHEIHTGKDYIVKIAHNNVKVKVLSNTGRGWVAKTAGGKFIPINSIERFVRAVQVAPAGELPLQTPAAPAENHTTVPEPKTPPQLEIPTEVQQNEVVTAPATPVAKPKNKLTMLDAAAIVLEKAGHPMTLQEILDTMIESEIWIPGPGKTPKNTLQASIGLETRKRIKHRFHKTAPGTFEYVGHRHE